MQKIPGVKSVRVSLNEGLTVLDLEAGNAVTLAQLRQVLKHSGFVSRDARLDANGVVSTRGAELSFAVSGTGETFVVQPGRHDSASYDAIRKRAATGPLPVKALKGVAPAPLKEAPTLEVAGFP